MENYDRVKELTEESAKSAGTADQKYEAYMDGMEAATKRLENAWESFTMKLESSKILKTTSEVLAFIVGNMDKLVSLLMTGLTTLKANKIFNFFTGGKGTGGLKDGATNFFKKALGLGDVTIDEKGNGLYKTENRTRDNLLKGILETAKSINSDTKDIIRKKAEDVASLPTNNTVETNKGKKTVDQLNNGIVEIPSVWTYALRKEYRKDLKKFNIFGSLSDDKLRKIDNLLETTYKAAAIPKKTGLVLGAWDTYYGKTKLSKDEINELKNNPILGNVLNYGAADKTASTIIGDYRSAVSQLRQSGIQARKSSKYSYSPADTEALERIRYLYPSYSESINQLRKQKLKQGALAGGTAALGRLTQTKQVNSGITKYWDKTNQTVEEDWTDKGIGIAATGAVAAVGGYIAGPLGAMLGQVIGDNVGDIISWFRHRDELEMKQRVQEAKENLTALNKISDTIESNGNILKSDFTTADSNKQLTDFIDSLRISLNEAFEGGLDEENLILNISNKMDELDNSELMVSFADANSLLNVIADYSKSTDANTKNMASQLARLLQAEIYRQAIEETIESQEEERRNINKLWAEGSYEEANRKESSLNRAVRQQIVNYGLTAANIWDFTQDELSDLGVGGLIQRIANTITNDLGNQYDQYGVLRLDSGVINSDYYNAISQEIKSRNEFSILLKHDQKTIGELLKARQDLGEKIKSNVDYDNYNDLRIAEQKGQLVGSNLEKLYYAADPQRIEDFARAWNLSLEGVEKISTELPGLTTAMGMMNLSEIKEYFQQFRDIIDDILQDSMISIENFEKILSNFPDLVSKIFDKTQEITDITSILTSEISSMEVVSNVNSLFTSLKENQNVFRDFKEKNIDEMGNDLIKIAENSNTLQEFIDATPSDIKSSVSELINSYFNKDIVLDYEDPILDKLIKFRTESLQKQANLYQEQLNSLEEINDQHKKELEYYKAQEALENAKANKEAIYREGIGWVYEANEDEIMKAKETLDDLELEKNKEEIQRQIDSLNVQKQILDNLESNKELESIKESLNLLTDNGKSSVASLVDAFNNQSLKINFGTGEIEFTHGVDADGNPITEKKNINDWTGTGATNASEQTMQSDLYKTYQAYQDYLSNPSVKTAQAYKSSYNEGLSKYGSDWKTTYIKDQYGNVVKPGGLGEIGNTDKDLVEKYIKNTNMTKNEVRNALFVDGSIKDLYNSLETKDKDELINLGKDKIRIVLNDPGSKNKTALGDGEFRTYTDFPTTARGLGQNFKVSFGGVKYKTSLGYRKSPSDAGNYKKEGELIYDDGTVYIYTGGRWVSLARRQTDELAAAIYKNKDKFDTYASGTTSSVGGSSLINEFGTEAIITPQGTVTALPSKTGVVPADITKNLWSLGEIAPTLVAQLSTLSGQKFSSNIGNNTYEEGQYIDNLIMNIYPTKDYDMDRLLAEARAKFRLTKHNN